MGVDKGESRSTKVPKINWGRISLFLEQTFLEKDNPKPSSPGLPCVA